MALICLRNYDVYHRARDYLGVVADDDDEISEEEEAAVLEGIADLEAGRVVPYETAMRELRARLNS